MAANENLRNGRELLTFEQRQRIADMRLRAEYADRNDDRRRELAEADALESRLIREAREMREAS